MSAAWIAAVFAPAAVTLAVIACLLRTRWASRLADLPNERSLHEVPTPRVGGLALMLGALPVAACFADAPLAIILSGAAFLAAVSAADDRKSLPIQVRLPAHFAASGVVVLAIGAPGLNAFEVLASIVGLVWMTNLFNFMDGADGLAGGIAAIGFAALALAAARAGHAPLALTATAITSASLGFLAFNFPPARAFLGDAGSIPLGFLAGALGLHGALLGAWPAWFPLVVFSPFIADASVTIAVRGLRREPIWRAHRGHYYQRLVLGGWTRRRLAVCSYALAAAAAASALLGLASGAQVQLGILVGWAAFYALLFLAIERRARAP